jgi:hypothetical protein
MTPTIRQQTLIGLLEIFVAAFIVASSEWHHYTINRLVFASNIVLLISGLGILLRVWRQRRAAKLLKPAGRS